MPMKMGWRWYGEGNDPVTLSDIKQIPGVTSIVWALHNKMPGEIWEIDEIQKVADQIHAYGFDMDRALLSTIGRWAIWLSAFFMSSKGRRRRCAHSRYN